MALKFEWDENKSRSNLKKHGVDFQEGKTVLMIHLPLQFMILIIRSPKRDILISVSHRKDGFWLCGIQKEMIKSE